MPRRGHGDAQYGSPGESDAADGVDFVRVGLTPTPPQSGGAVTVALYAGMTVVELQSVLRAALGLSSTSTCAGFVVSHSHCATTMGKKKHHAPKSDAVRERIVPLTIACLSPEVLHSPSGYARVLVTPSSTGASSCLFRGNAMATASDSHVHASQRLQRLVAALRDEDASLSSFESAILAEICEQRADYVLREMQSTHTSLTSKKQFLLSLVRPARSRVDAAQNGGGHELRAPVSTSTATRSGSDSTGGGSGSSNAQVDLICKKVVSIAHTVFSPHVQSDLMTEASLYRERQRRASVTTGSSAGHDRGPRSGPESASVSNVMELLGVVERLLNKHALQEEQSVKLIRLVLAENRMLFSALQSYKLDFNLNELESTIKRMAALGGPSPASSSSLAPTVADIPANALPTQRRRHEKTESPSTRTTSPRRKATPAVAAKPKDRQGFIVRPHDILHTLYQKTMITTLEFDLLRALVNQNDTQVLVAVSEYEHSHQLSVLRDQLVAIVAEITNELGDDEKCGDNEEIHVDHSIDHWQERLIQCVQYWFTQRKLTGDHVHVLRCLIEENHNLLQSAFEVFAADGDESELLDTLQRIAKLQVQANEGALVAAFAQVVDQHCDVLRTVEKTLVKQLFARKNELARAAWEVFEVEQNLEDFGDTLLRIARFATRQDTKLRLVEVVGEMMQRDLIQSHEADGLILLFEEKNEAMVAANEAFESDCDVKELVETLLLIVKHANFGDAPQCSSPRRKIGSPRATMTPPSSPVSDYGGGAVPFSLSSALFAADSEAFFAARLIEVLGSKGRLAKWQIDLLLRLLAASEAGDDRVFAIIDVYNDERDARELVDSLWRLCDLIAWNENKAKIVAQYMRPLGRDACRVLEKLVELRDDRLIAAFVVFLGDNKRDEFVDTLVRLARLEGAQAVHEDQSQAEDDDANQQLRVILARLVHSSHTSLSRDQVSALEALLAERDAATLAAFDVYRETQDVEDFVDTLGRIVAIRHSDPNDCSSLVRLMDKQLLHFASELDGVTADEVAALKQLIARKDSIIEAAVEVYQAERDEEDLKDTLKRIAVHAAAAKHV